MKNNFLLFIFLFCNLYNPLSIYFTLFVDLCILLSLSDNYRIYFRLDTYVSISTLLILLLSIFSMTLNLNYNTYVFGKYSRVFISSILIGLICNNLRVSLKQIINSLSLVFIFHIVVVLAEIVYPDISLPIASFFGFGREEDVITKMSFRKLGLSTSYDTAGLIAVLSMILFFFRYYCGNKALWLLMSLASLISCVFISRTAMLLGATLMFFLLIYLFLTKHGYKRLVAFIGLACCIYVVFLLILPIFASSTSLFEYNYEPNVSYGNDYTSGSVPGLMGGDHLNALRSVSFCDLIFGYGIDPNLVEGMASDIGYVKIIYHIGIIGLMCILCLYYYLFKKIIRNKTNSILKNIDMSVLYNFLILYIVIMLFFNYKSLEIYSRGTHDLMLILFYFFCILSFNQKNDYNASIT